jgi:heparan-alpha-glucosaminide N-acetyltransferase
MGVCIPISVKSQLKRTSNKIYILFSILKVILLHTQIDFKHNLIFANVQRSCILFGLGVMLNTLPAEWQMEKLRIFGVLQRFGILYFICASVCTLCWPSLPKMVTTTFISQKTTLGDA